MWSVLCSVQRKLRTFRHKVHSALLPQRRAPRSPCSPVLTGRNKRATSLHSIRSQNKSLALRAGDGGRRQKKRRRSSVSGLLRDKQKNKSGCEGISETTTQNSHNDIDDIFASIGLWCRLWDHHFWTKGLCCGKKMTVSDEKNERWYQQCDKNVEEQDSWTFLKHIYCL